MSLMCHDYEGHQSVSMGNYGGISTLIYCNKAIKYANKLKSGGKNVIFYASQGFN